MTRRAAVQYEAEPGRADRGRADPAVAVSVQQVADGQRGRVARERRPAPHRGVPIAAVLLAGTPHNSHCTK